MAESLPYLVSPGTLNTAFQKIRSAATPDRFTHDFLSETLGMKGGSAAPVIPFLKKTGFLGTDGAPTELYRSFRNPTQSGHAVAQAMRIGYGPLFDMNEQAHLLSDSELRGLTTQATGLESDSRVNQLILGTFKAMKKHASFDAPAIAHQNGQPENGRTFTISHHEPLPPSDVGINLSYTINLNLPPSTDISVFNAIFKALKENLLKP